MAVAVPSQPVPTRTAPAIRVVLADDSAAFRTLARHALSAERGFSVAEAADGVEALAALDSFDADCMVLDIQMPRMGGFEALARLRERSPDLPVILLSGESDRDVADEARRRGAVSYVDKTASLAGLADAVRAAATTGAAASAGDLSMTPADAREGAAGSGPPGGSSGESTAAAAGQRDLAAELKRLEYVVSHELGEPVRIMSGFAGLLSSRYAEALDDSGRTFLTHITSAAARLQGMLDDLLAYSRAGRVEPKIATVDLTAVARAAVDVLRDEIAAREASVTVEDLPPATADPALVQTVFRLVIANALLFTEAAPVVEIAGRLDGDSVTITICDNGIGVPAADRERVFDLFVRLHPRDAFPGTGTGLTLSRRLVGLLGGSISLDAGDGGGSTVTIRLPAAVPHPPSPAESHDGTH